MMKGGRLSVTERALEALFLDNSSFEELSSKLEVFCPFEAIGMVGQEIRHGFFLHYILNPQRPHGFGSECLRSFMWAAATALREEGSSPIRPLDVHLMDLDTAVVEREHRSIDLLVQSPSEKLVVAIELKIDSGEHSGQLGRYKKIIERDFPSSDGWKQVLLFVTKRGDEPSGTDGEGWCALPLDAVTEALHRALNRGSGHPDARQLLGAYISMLRRKHLTDQRLEDLARDLWREHREVMDFLTSRRPDIASEVLTRIADEQSEIASTFSEACGLKVVRDHSTKTIIRFAVEDWDDVAGMLTGSGWPPSKRILLFELFRDPKGFIRCQFELGPGNAELRTQIFETLKTGSADVGGNWELSPKWRQLANAKLVTVSEDMAADEVYEKTIKQASAFLRKHAPVYQAALEPLMS